MDKQMKMMITWLGQSCFRIEADGYVIVLDPYEDYYVPGLGKIREAANEVLCSHEHRDHAGVSGVELLEGKPSPFHVTQMESFHDDKRGALRGMNTIRILQYGDLRVAHLGDLGGELSSEQMERLTGLDAVMVPVGGYYTIDAQQAADLIKKLRPRVAIPMHYRGENFGYDVLETPARFLEKFDNVISYPGGTLELTADTPVQTALLGIRCSGEQEE